MDTEAQRLLIEWYGRCGRDLPWRRTRDPYAIWVSEVMLQQTQVETALPYYARWMERFPTLRSLADADEQDALAIWQGLGYYRRCRMLHQAARMLAGEALPTSSQAWRKVPGVGRYTAGAVASITLSERAAAVDGNVERVFARFTGCELTGHALNRAAWQWAESLVPRQEPGRWNQALMELGARVCTPARPRCSACPLRDACAAHVGGLVDQLPRPKPRPAVVEVETEIWVTSCGERFGVRRIEDGSWWRGLWGFPTGTGDMLRAAWPMASVRAAGTHRHTVTRHRILLRVFSAWLVDPASGLHWVTREDLDRLPMPAPHRKALAMADRSVDFE
ncbi:MAG TPA: A/G-specific adenine glycosylase [Fimbriimonadaceae bacterium]|nr:A/G-specific adenine glycosylase [Fimbriimonadaceae bacterium]